MDDPARFLGFSGEPQLVTESPTLSSNGRRLVPWLNWDEWLFVKRSLFSDSPNSISSALTRISVWRSRGCLPVFIQITASIVEVQLKDPYFRKDGLSDASLSEEMLAMLYCMAIMRLVNGAVEKTRRKEVASIAVAGDAIGIPRMLIDIRHEGSHRELPSLKIVRSASVKALDWLKSFYWEPQSKAIPFQGEGIAKVKKEIKSKIRELAICLKVSGSAQSSSSLLKGKKFKHGELLSGRNKFLSLVVGKSQMSKTKGSKKQSMKILKYIVKLYSSFSSEIVSVLLEYLLKALNSSELEEIADDASIGLTTQNVLADWKLVILKLCKKEPELLLNLLKKVLDMIETKEDMKYKEDSTQIGISHSRAEIQQSIHLSSLFAWLVEILSKAPSTAASMPKIVLQELLRKCLLTSRLCNKQLMDSALQLAELMDDNRLTEKVRKFSLIRLFNLDSADDQSSLLTSTNILQFEESIHEAAKKLELLKQQIMKNKKPLAMDCDTKKSQTWSLAKSWKPCPIGMLPSAVGSSGCLPVLDIYDDEKQKCGSLPGLDITANDNQKSDCLPILDLIDNEKQNQVSKGNENWKLTPHGAKRDATIDLPLLDNSIVKKMKETKEFGEVNNELSMKGCLMIGGVWKKLTKEDQLAIESSIRILI